jgi:tRNA1Val (adenine37-N6)-methyltransferase
MALFNFKEFSIRHDRCTWKVGIDSILLGSWCDLSAATYILDAGCGSGILALMAAQKCPNAHIDGIEIDAASAHQAIDNVESSKWSACIRIIHGDITSDALFNSRQYDHIISNPPYFTDAVHPVRTSRQTARRGVCFSLMDLPEIFRSKLFGIGKVSVILPAPSAYEFISRANCVGLFVQRRLNVRHHIDHEDKLVLLELGSEIRSPHIAILPLYEGQAPSEEYQNLTRQFLSFDRPATERN